MSPVQPGADCLAVRERTTPYLDGELPAAETARIDTHLEACPGCARITELERHWGGVVRSGLGRAAASPRLRERILAGLDEVDASVPAVRSSRMPVLAMAASILLAAVIIGGAAGRLLGPSGFDGDGGPGTPATVIPVNSLAGVVVDVQCDQMGKPFDMQRTCSHPDHVIGMRCDGDRYLNVSLAGNSGRGMFERPNCGREVIVSGFERRDSGVLEVREATWRTLVSGLL